MKKLMKYKILFLIFCLSFSDRGVAASISPSGQATLLKVFLQHLPCKSEVFKIGILCNEESKTKDIQKELSKSTFIHNNGNKLRLEVRVLNPHSKIEKDFHAVYSSGLKVDLKHPIPVFSDDKEAWKQGALVKFGMLKASPKVYVNLNQLKQLKLSFPASLMKFVTLVEGK
jgi:hypothetical protein